MNQHIVRWLDSAYDVLGEIRWTLACAAWRVGLESIGNRLEADYCYCKDRYDGEGHRPHIKTDDQHPLEEKS